jgi:hypothetical protein
MCNQTRVKPVFCGALLLALALMAACSRPASAPAPGTINPGDWGLITLETPDVRFYPQDGRGNVPVNAAVELYFTMDMDQENGWSVTVNGVEYSRYDITSASWQNRALVITPAEPFEQGSAVTVVASGFVSAEGIAMEAKYAAFTVVQYGAPSVTIMPTGTDVNPSSDVRLEFNQAVLTEGAWKVKINTAEYGAGSTGISWSGLVLTIAPPDPPGYHEPGSDVLVTAENFVTRFGGAAFPSASASFTVDAELPEILFTPNVSSPAASIVTQVHLKFDKDVDAACGWQVTLDGVTYTQGLGSAEISWSGYRDLYIKHAGKYLTRGTVDVEAQYFMAADGYPYDTASAQFAVKTVPTISGNIVNGQTDVPLSANIVLTFDDPVKDAGGWQVVIDGDADDPGNETAVYSRAAPAGTSWNAARTELTIDPADFLPGKNVRVDATGFTALDDVSFQDLGFTFTAKWVSVTGVSLNKTATTIYENAADPTEKLIATVLPPDASDKRVNWVSSAPGVASVDADGVVTAQSVGTADITVTTLDGGKTATCEVTVGTIIYPVTGVSLDRACATVQKDGTLLLTATVLPANATNPGVTWESSAVSVATVDENGLVTAVGYGTATVTVRTVDGGKTATCRIDVPDPGACEIGVYQGVTGIPDGGSYAFPGYTLVGNESAPVTFTIKNESLMPLEIQGVDSSDETRFRLNTSRMPELPDTLEFGETAEFDVTFVSGSWETQSAVITVTSDDPDEGIYEFTVTGRGRTEMPYVASYSPASGSSLCAGSIEINFSEPMNTAGGWKVAVGSDEYTKDTAGDPGTCTWSEGDTRLTIVPAGILPYMESLAVTPSGFTAAFDSAPMEESSATYRTDWKARITIQAYGIYVVSEDEIGGIELFWHCQAFSSDDPGDIRTFALRGRDNYITVSRGQWVYPSDQGFLTPVSLDVTRIVGGYVRMNMFVADCDTLPPDDDVIADHDLLDMNYQAGSDTFSCNYYNGSGDFTVGPDNYRGEWIIPIDGLPHEYVARFGDLWFELMLLFHYRITAEKVCP